MRSDTQLLAELNVGEVTSWQERENAEMAAWSAQGIARVQNMLSVRL